MSSEYVILVGHGAPPRDAPPAWVSRVKALEGQRRRAKTPMTNEERELDGKLRNWPRTPHNDPYAFGVEELARALRPMVSPRQLLIAYNEFCQPSIEDAVASAAKQGATDVVVVPTMLTPGGVHSEVEIPEELEALRARFPSLRLRYAWPFDVAAVAKLLSAQLDACSIKS